MTSSRTLDDLKKKLLDAGITQLSFEEKFEQYSGVKKPEENITPAKAVTYLINAAFHLRDKLRKTHTPPQTSSLFWKSKEDYQIKLLPQIRNAFDEYQLALIQYQKFPVDMFNPKDLFMLEAATLELRSESKDFVNQLKNTSLRVMADSVNFCINPPKIKTTVMPAKVM